MTRSSRRALGATRATIVALVVFWAGFAATAGVLVGTATGLVIGGQLGVAVPADFGVGVAVLALMTSVTAAVPPAFFAATRVRPVINIVLANPDVRTRLLPDASDEQWLESLRAVFDRARQQSLQSGRFWDMPIPGPQDFRRP